MSPPAARRRHLSALLIGLAAALLPASPLPAQFLYRTDFENFPTGPDQWVGTSGWIGNSTGVGAHGIDANLLPGLGKTAFLGFQQPTSTFVSVAKPFNYDPVAQGSASIQIESLLGLEDSTNGKRDNFYLSFYNPGGNFLAALLFSNHPATYGIWRLDGVGQFDTTIDFIIGELHLITIDINHAANTWSADMDGIPLFLNAPFTTTGRTRTLGPVAYEWILSGATPAEFGNNWMLVADFSVLAVPPGEGPFVMDEILLSESGHPLMAFTGEPGWTYRVEYSDNGADWKTDLPGSLFTGLETPVQVQFTDPTDPVPPGRLYRIVRSVTP